MRSLISFTLLCSYFHGLAVAQDLANWRHHKDKDKKPDERGTTKCVDKVDEWEDLLYNKCKWYGDHSDARCKWARALKVKKLDATEICCECGGGQLITEEPTLSPTPSPSLEPTKKPIEARTSPAPTVSPTLAPSQEPTEKYTEYHIFSIKGQSYIGYEDGQIKLFSEMSDFTKIAIIPVSEKQGFGVVRLKFTNPSEPAYIRLSMQDPESVRVGTHFGYSLFIHASISVGDSNLSTFNSIEHGKQYFLGVIDNELTTVMKEENRKALFRVVEATVETPVPTLSPTTSPTLSPTVNPTMSPSATPTVSLTLSPSATPTSTPTDNPTATPTSLVTISYIKSRAYDGTYIGYKGGEIQMINEKNYFTQIIIEPVEDSRTIDRVRLLFVNPRAPMYLSLNRDGSLSTTVGKWRGSIFMLTKIPYKGSNISVFNSLIDGEDNFLAVLDGRLTTTAEQEDSALFTVEDEDRGIMAPTASPTTTNIPTVNPTATPTALSSGLSASYLKSLNDETYIGYKEGKIQMFAEKYPFTKILIEPVDDSRAIGRVRIKLIYTTLPRYLILREDGSISASYYTWKTTIFIQTKIPSIVGGPDLVIFNAPYHGEDHFLAVKDGQITTTSKQETCVLFLVESD